MSILNTIITGGGGEEWSEVTNATASTTAISFPIDHEPTKWAVISTNAIVNASSTTKICYIMEDGGTYYEYGIHTLSSRAYFTRSGTPTMTYNNGTFTVTSGSASFTTTVGDYVLIYI